MKKKLYFIIEKERKNGGKNVQNIYNVKKKDLFGYFRQKKNVTKTMNQV